MGRAAKEYYLQVLIELSLRRPCFRWVDWFRHKQGVGPWPRVPRVRLCQPLTHQTLRQICCIARTGLPRLVKSRGSVKIRISWCEEDRGAGRRRGLSRLEHGLSCSTIGKTTTQCRETDWTNQCPIPSDLPFEVLMIDMNSSAPHSKFVSLWTFDAEDNWLILKTIE